MKKFIRTSLILILLFLAATPVLAQGDQPEGLVYIVQPGDTLWTIARNLHVPYDALLSRNGLDQESAILPGTELAVPGLAGFSGILTTTRISFGETLTSLSRQYQVPKETLIRLNRLTTPLELYAGVSVVLLETNQGEQNLGERVSLALGETPLEMAVQADVNPWELMLSNAQEGQWSIVPGEVFFVPGTSSSGPGAFPAEITKVSYEPDSFVQGHTSTIEMRAPDQTTVEGSLGKYPLHFFEKNPGTYLSLQGLHAKEELGLKPLSISGMLPDGTPFAHQQMVRVLSGEYIFEDIGGVPTETIGLDNTEEESLKLEAIADNASPKRYWSGSFVSPVQPEFSEAYSSYFGNRRSYNGSGYLYFHTGLDFYSNQGDSIFSAAPGKVIYVGDLPIHGGTTMIDHGWGVYTLYAHQSEILTREGASVSAGELIGRIGSTGRSSGPHLHWEIWVGGVQVDPLDWLKNTYP